MDSHGHEIYRQSVTSSYSTTSYELIQFYLDVADISLHFRHAPKAAISAFHFGKDEAGKDQQGLAPCGRMTIAPPSFQTEISWVTPERACSPQSIPLVIWAVNTEEEIRL